MAYFKYLKENTRTPGIYDEISDFHLKMLSKIYHTCNCKIVLSSTWRILNNEESEECDEMYQYLLNCLSKYGMEIISKTPVISQERPLEIKNWLDNREDKAEINFVILDDDFDKADYDNYDIGAYLVKTSFYCNDLSEGGLQEEHVEKAIQILKKQELN